MNNSSKAIPAANLTRRQFNRLIGGSALAAPLIGSRAFGQDAATFKIGYIGPQSGPLGIFGAADSYLIDTIRTNLAGGIDVNGSKMMVEIITAIGRTIKSSASGNSTAFQPSSVSCDHEIRPERTMKRVD